MKFIDTAANRKLRFSIGRELESGRCYLSIPVSNRLCDYEEYCEIERSMHDAHPGNVSALASIAELGERYMNPGTDLQDYFERLA